MLAGYFGCLQPIREDRLSVRSATQHHGEPAVAYG
jgi:hypothetical protein